MINILSKLNNIIKSFYNKIIKKKDNIVYKLNEEIDTGDIWIDGRKIYIYIFEETLTVAGWNRFSSPLVNKHHEILDVYAIIYPTQEHTVFSVPGWYVSCGYAYADYLTCGFEHVNFVTTPSDGSKSTLYNGSKVRIFLKYTK